MYNFIPEQLPDDQKILRFLDFRGLMGTLGIQEKEPRETRILRPTFMLCSLDYYRSLGKKDARGDTYEAISVATDQKTESTNTLCNSVLASCWSTYNQGDLSLPKTWYSFPRRIAAIESTVGDLKRIMNALCGISEIEGVSVPNNGSLRSMKCEHGKVKYYDPTDPDRRQLSADPTYFLKRKSDFEKEQEYRFTIIFDSHSLFAPESYIVRLQEDVRSYIKKIYIQQSLFPEEEKKTIDTLEAYYGDILEQIPQSTQLISNQSSLEKDRIFI